MQPTACISLAIRTIPRGPPTLEQAAKQNGLYRCSRRSYLASASASSVTDAVIAVDGGRTAV